MENLKDDCAYATDVCGASAIPSVLRWLICTKLLETPKKEKRSRNIR